MYSQANVRAGNVLLPPIRALQSVTVVTEKGDAGSGWARWKSGVDCSLRVGKVIAPGAPRKPDGGSREEPEDHKCDEYFRVTGSQ